MSAPAGIGRRWRLQWNLLAAGAVAGGAFAASDFPLDKIRLPPGFSIELVARVPNARAMAWGATGERGSTLFVGTMQQGTVYALSLPARGSLDKAVVHRIASGLN